MPLNFSNLNNLFNDDLYLKEKQKKIWLVIFGVLIVFTIGAAIISFPLFLNKNYTEQASVSTKETTENNLSLLNEKNTLNILVLGVPGAGNDAPNLTDTILIASAKKDSLSLISIPRDLLIEIPDQNRYTKINALYAMTENPEATLIKAEEITGLKIDKYAVVDLQVIKELINQVGGLNLLVEKNIYDTLYPDDNHTYQTFALDKGWRYFDGDRALKYIRSRESTSDFDRMGRQQQVIGALKNKLSATATAGQATALNWNLKNITDVYQTLTSRIKTDLNVLEIWQLWQTTKKIPNEQINKYVIDREFLVDDQVILGGATAFVLVPRAGSEDYSEIKNYIQQKSLNTN